MRNCVRSTSPTCGALLGLKPLWLLPGQPPHRGEGTSVSTGLGGFNLPPSALPPPVPRSASVGAHAPLHTEAGSMSHGIGFPLHSGIDPAEVRPLPREPRVAPAVARPPATATQQPAESCRPRVTPTPTTTLEAPMLFGDWSSVSVPGTATAALVLCMENKRGPLSVLSRGRWADEEG